MNAQHRNQPFAFTAAMFCAFVMIGTSIAPALNGGIV